jgi:hypothetical protein
MPSSSGSNRPKRDYLAGTHPECFFWGVGADPKAIYNLCLILKIML